MGMHSHMSMHSCTSTHRCTSTHGRTSTHEHAQVHEHTRAHEQSKAASSRTETHKSTRAVPGDGASAALSARVARACRGLLVELAKAREAMVNVLMWEIAKNAKDTRTII